MQLYIHLKRCYKIEIMNLIKLPNFDVRLLPDADKFIRNLEKEERTHIYLKLSIAQFQNDPRKFTKVRGNIWEFRFQFKKKAFRLYSFWCEKQESLVIATHGIIKKQQKAPLKEIEKAEKIRREYYKV